MSLLKFELKKMWHNNTLLILTLIILLSVAAIFFRNAFMQENISHHALLNIADISQEVFELHREIESEYRSDFENEELQLKYENAQEMQDSLDYLAETFKNETWIEVPQAELDFLHTVQNHLNMGEKFHTLTESDIQQNIEKNELLISRQLPFEDETYSLATPNFIKSAGTVILSTIAIFVFVLIAGSQLGDEYNQHTIRTMYTQPLRKWQIILSKYTSMMGIVFIATIVFFLMSLVISLIWGDGFGSFHYPQLTLTDNGFVYITTANYLIKLIIMFVGASSFAISVSLFTGAWIKDKMMSILVSFIVLIIGIFVTNQFDGFKSAFNPFYYFHLTELIERPNMLGFFGFVTVLFIYSALILFFSIFLLDKQTPLRMASVYSPPFNEGQTFNRENTFLAISLFEWRKLKRYGHFKQAMILLAMLLFGGYLFVNYQTTQVEEGFIEKTIDLIKYQEDVLIPWHEDVYQGSKQEISELESLGEDLNDEEIARLEGMRESLEIKKNALDYARYRLDEMNEMLKAFQEKDWSTYYNYWIFRNKVESGEIKIDHEDNFFRELDISTYQASIDEKEILVKNNLKPILPSQYIYTIYNQFPNQMRKLEWQRENTRIDSSGLYTLYMFFNYYVYLLPLILFLFLFGLSLAKEKGNKRTLAFLETEPLPKLNIFTGKIAVSLILSIGISLGLILLLILLGTVFDRFGDWSFPILHYDLDRVISTGNEEHHYHFITLGSYIVKTSLLFLAVSVFLIILSLFVSLFLNQMISSFGISTMIVLGGYFLSTSSIVGNYSHLSPFTYLNIGKITNGEIAYLVSNARVEVWTGISVLLSTSIVLLVAGVIIVRIVGLKRG